MFFKPREGTSLGTGFINYQFRGSSRLAPPAVDLDRLAEHSFDDGGAGCSRGILDFFAFIALVASGGNLPRNGLYKPPVSREFSPRTAGCRFGSPKWTGLSGRLFHPTGIDRSTNPITIPKHRRSWCKYQMCSMLFDRYFLLFCE